MIIAVASGKGGTGKTTLSASLTRYASENVMLLDCDVEEPNADLFFDIPMHGKSDVAVNIPSVDKALCSGCGRCSAFCRFNAIAVVSSKPLVFKDMCHSCGGCVMVCPNAALSWREEVIGCIESGSRGGTTLVKGTLAIGHAMAPPLIRAVKKRIQDEGLVIIDSPPGTSCPMITAVRGSDFVILVTEPTPFGLHDLTLAVRTVRSIGLPFGVIINRCDSGDDRVEIFCSEEKIPVLLSIPDDRRIAESYSTGHIDLGCIPGLEEKIRELPRLISSITAGGGK